MIKPEIPVSLQSCADAPNYPGNDMTQRDIAGNYTKLWFAHKDCKSKLKAVHKAIGGENAKIMDEITGGEKTKLKKNFGLHL